MRGFDLIQKYRWILMTGWWCPVDSNSCATWDSSLIVTDCPFSVVMGTNNHFFWLSLPSDVLMSQPLRCGLSRKSHNRGDQNVKQTKMREICQGHSEAWHPDDVQYARDNVKLTTEVVGVSDYLQTTSANTASNSRRGAATNGQPPCTSVCLQKLTVGQLVK
jgi:hypothetical protein